VRSCSDAATAGMLLVLAGGLAFGACDRKKDDAATVAPAAPVPVTGELQVLAGEHGFTPSSLSLPKGGPGSKATVTFVRTSDKTCATEVVFPEVGIEKPLPLGQPVAVDVPTDAARTLTFQCGMAMYKGALVVR